MPVVKLILLELNELSPDLMSRFIDEGKLPNFRRLRTQSTLYTTDACGNARFQSEPILGDRKKGPATTFGLGSKIRSRFGVARPRRFITRNTWSARERTEAGTFVRWSSGTVI